MLVAGGVIHLFVDHSSNLFIVPVTEQIDG